MLTPLNSDSPAQKSPSALLKNRFQKPRSTSSPLSGEGRLRPYDSRIVLIISIVINSSLSSQRRHRRAVLIAARKGSNHRIAQHAGAIVNVHFARKMSTQSIGVLHAPSNREIVNRCSYRRFCNSTNTTGHGTRSRDDLAIVKSAGTRTERLLVWKTEHHGVDTHLMTFNQESVVQGFPTDRFCLQHEYVGASIRPLRISRTTSGKKRTRKHGRAAQNAFVVVAPEHTFPRTKPTTTTRSQNKHGNRQESPPHRQQSSGRLGHSIPINSGLFTLVAISLRRDFASGISISLCPTVSSISSAFRLIGHIPSFQEN